MNFFDGFKTYEERLIADIPIPAERLIQRRFAEFEEFTESPFISRQLHLPTPNYPPGDVGYP